MLSLSNGISDVCMFRELRWAMKLVSNSEDLIILLANKSDLMFKLSFSKSLDISYFKLGLVSIFLCSGFSLDISNLLDLILSLLFIIYSIRSITTLFRLIAHV